MAIDFNVDPYFDDFSENKQFYKILFKPGRAVQARELNQLQTILQKQISRFGSFVFKEGSLVSGAQHYIDDSVFYIKCKALYGASIVNFSDIEGKYIKESGTNRVGIVKKVITATGGDPASLFVTIIQGSQTKFNDNTQFTVYNDRELITPFKYFESETTNSSGVSLLFHVGEGVFFAKETFLYCPDQTIVLSKYDKTGSYLVGLTIEETVVDSNDDITLLDPAVGTTNYFAPGANRYKISLTLSTKTYTAEAESYEDFIELVKIKDGQILKDIRIPIFSELGDTLARRTYDESGDYIVKPFTPKIELDPASNSNIVLEISAGKAYVRGYEIETISPTYLTLDRTTSTDSDTEYEVDTYSGNYIYVRDLYGNLPTINTDYPVEIHNTFTNQSSSTKIGTAYVKNLDYHDGTLSNAVFTMSLQDISITNGTFSLARSIIKPNGSNYTTPSFRANIESSSIENNATFITEPGADVQLFNIPYSYVSSVSGVEYYYKQRFTGTVSSGQVAINCAGSDDFVSVSTATGYRTHYTVVNTTTGQFIPLDSNSATVSVAGSTATIDFNTSAYNGDSVSVIATVRTSDGVTRTKTLTTATVSCSIVSTSPVSLLKSDVYSLDYVYELTSSQTYIGTWSSGTTYAANDVVIYNNVAYYSVSSSNTGNTPSSTSTRWTAITNSSGYYTFDSGQKDNYYDHGTITRRSSPLNTITVLAVIRHFTHTGSGHLSVSSYSINYGLIPTYKSKVSGKEYKLSDVLDFRPRRTDDTSAFSLSTHFKPQPFTNTIIDLSYYLKRIDRIVLTRDGTFKVFKGVPAYINPKAPVGQEDSITLFLLTLQQFVSAPEDVTIQVLPYKRYTMKDIANMDDRLTRMEYVTSLSLLEKEISNKSFTDTYNNPLFNNGFLVDSFKGFSAGDLVNPDFQCSIDKTNGVLRPTYDLQSIDLKYSNSTSTAALSLNNILTVPYQEETFINQALASKSVSANPFNVVSYVGRLYITPKSDIWFDSNTIPAVIINDNGENDHLISGTGLETAWNSWEYNWFGELVERSTTASTGNRFILDPSKNTVISGIQIPAPYSVVPFARSREINFYVEGMSPDTDLYLYINEKNCTQFLFSDRLLNSGLDLTTTAFPPVSTTSSAVYSRSSDIPLTVNYGVYVTSTSDAATGIKHIRYRNWTAPYSGNYTVEIAGDDIVDISLIRDGVGASQVLASYTLLPSSGLSTQATFYAPAGNHVLEYSVYNHPYSDTWSVNPGIIAAIIKNSSGTVIWDTRTYAAAETVSVRVAGLRTNQHGQASGVIKFPNNDTFKFLTGPQNIVICDNSVSLKDATTYAEATYLCQGVFDKDLDTARRYLNYGANANVIISSDNTPNATYILSTDRTVVREGDSVTFVLTAQNSPPGRVFRGNISGTVAQADISGVTLGNVSMTTLGTRLHNKSEITVSIATDAGIEGDEFLTLEVDIPSSQDPKLGGPLKLTSNVRVIDEKVNYYTLSSPAYIVEGGNANVILTVSNLASSANITYSVISGYSDVNSNISNANVGSFVLTAPDSNHQLTFSFTDDSVVEGSEPFYIVFSTPSGNLSANINIVDKALKSWSVRASNSVIKEGESVTFTVDTLNVESGNTVPYTITGITSGDLSSGSLTGTITINANTKGSTTITLAEDRSGEGVETILFSLGYPYPNNSSVSVNVLDTSASGIYGVYVLGMSVIKEGVGIDFCVDTLDVATGATPAYTISGISSGDLAAGSLTGTVTIGANGRGYANVVLSADGSAELNGETLSFDLTGYNARANVKIIDYAVANVATYGLKTSNAVIREGESFTITVNSSNNLSTGSSGAITIPYSVGFVNGVLTLDDFTAASQALLANPNLTTDSTGNASITLTLREDAKTEASPETIAFTILPRDGSNQESIYVKVKDTSLSSLLTYEIVPIESVIEEGQVATFRVIARLPSSAEDKANLPSDWYKVYPIVQAAISTPYGGANVSDFENILGTGYSYIDDTGLVYTSTPSEPFELDTSTGIGYITIKLKADSITEGLEQFRISIYKERSSGGTVAGLLASSSVVQVKDTSNSASYAVVTGPASAAENDILTYTIEYNGTATLNYEWIIDNPGGLWLLNASGNSGTVNISGENDYIGYVNLYPDLRDFYYDITNNFETSLFLTKDYGVGYISNFQSEVKEKINSGNYVNEWWYVNRNNKAVWGENHWNLLGKFQNKALPEFSNQVSGMVNVSSGSPGKVYIKIMPDATTKGNKVLTFRSRNNDVSIQTLVSDTSLSPVFSYNYGSRKAWGTGDFQDSRETVASALEKYTYLKDGKTDSEILQAINDGKVLVINSTFQTALNAYASELLSIYRDPAKLNRNPDLSGWLYWLTDFCYRISSGTTVATAKAEILTNLETAAASLGQPFGSRISFLSCGTDPVAQTFFVDSRIYSKGVFLTGISLYFKSKDPTLPIFAEIRPTINGVPSSEKIVPLTTVFLTPSQVNTSDNASLETKFSFRGPVHLVPGEYCIVTGSNSNLYEVYVAELGASIIGSSNKLISTQPYVGSFFKSQNGSTWTPEQKEDLTFKLHKAIFDTGTVYTANLISNTLPISFDFHTSRLTSQELDFGSVTDINYQVKYSEGGTIDGTFANVVSNRNVELNTTKTANALSSVIVNALLKTEDKDISPVIDIERVSILAIKNIINNSANVVLSETLPAGGSARAKYVTKRVTLADGFDATGLRVLLDVNRPAGTSIEVYYKVLSSEDSDDFDDKYYQLMTLTPKPKVFTGDDEFIFDEYKADQIQYNFNGTVFKSFRTFAIKVVLLSNNPAIVPKVKNLRVVATS